MREEEDIAEKALTRARCLAAAGAGREAAAKARTLGMDGPTETW